MSKVWTMRAMGLTLAVGVALTAIASAAKAEDIKGWYGDVAKTIAKKQTYPRAAMQKEIQGKAKVKLVVGHDGKITNFEVVQPTGQQVLDEEIPKLVERLSPLPTPPAGTDDASLTFVVPLSWSLE